MSRSWGDLFQLANEFEAIALKLQPPCDCERCFDDMEPDAPFVYQCAGCKRTIPWCVGSDGVFVNGLSNFEYCNDCVIVIDRFLSATLPRPSQP